MMSMASGLISIGMSVLQNGKAETRRLESPTASGEARSLAFDARLIACTILNNCVFSEFPRTILATISTKIREVAATIAAVVVIEAERAALLLRNGGCRSE